MKIHTEMWRGDTVTALSATEKLLWAFLLTGPHAAALPGLFVLGPAHMAQATGASTRRVGLMLDKMSRLGMLGWNRRMYVVHLPSAAQDNRPENARVLASWYRRWWEFSECPEKWAYVESLRPAATGDTLIEAEWSRTFGAAQRPEPPRARRPAGPNIRHADPSVPKRTVIAVAARDGGLCRYCGAAADSIDHVLPRRQGGGNEPGNLVVCCLPCNTIKGNRTPEQAGMALLPIGGA